MNRSEFPRSGYPDRALLRSQFIFESDWKNILGQVLFSPRSYLRTETIAQVSAKISNILNVIQLSSTCTFCTRPVQRFEPRSVGFNTPMRLLVHLLVDPEPSVTYGNTQVVGSKKKQKYIQIFPSRQIRERENLLGFDCKGESRKEDFL